MSTSVSIFDEIFRVHSFFVSGHFRGASQILRGGLRGYKTSAFLICLNFRGPLTGLLVRRFVGLCGSPSGVSPWATLTPCALEISTVLWGSQAPLKPLRHTTGQ